MGCHVTTTWGAARRMAADKRTVNMVKAMRQTLSRTMAANFHSFSMMEASASALILSVTTRTSLRMAFSSISMPVGGGGAGGAGILTGLKLPLGEGME